MGKDNIGPNRFQATGRMLLDRGTRSTRRLANPAPGQLKETFVVSSERPQPGRQNLETAKPAGIPPTSSPAEAAKPGIPSTNSLRKTAEPERIPPASSPAKAGKPVGIPPASGPAEAVKPEGIPPVSSPAKAAKPAGIPPVGTGGAAQMPLMRNSGKSIKNIFELLSYYIKDTSHGPLPDNRDFRNRLSKVTLTAEVLKNSISSSRILQNLYEKYIQMLIPKMQQFHYTQEAALMFFRIFQQETEALFYQELCSGLKEASRELASRLHELAEELNRLNSELFSIRKAKTNGEDTSKKEKEYERRRLDSDARFQENDKKCRNLSQCITKVENIIKEHKENSRMIQLPDQFRIRKFWFASFSNDSIDGVWDCGKKSYAGSLYFDRGRIRLVHFDGPRVYPEQYVRTVGEVPLNRLNLESTISALKLDINSDTEKQEHIIEYYYGHVVHISRGIPGKVELTEDELWQIYYVAKKVTEMGSSKAVVEAGNHIFLDYFRLNHSLGQKLRYV